MLWVSSQGQVCLPRDLQATAISYDLGSKPPPPTLPFSSHLLLCSPPQSLPHLEVVLGRAVPCFGTQPPPAEQHGTLTGALIFTVGL